MTLFLMEAPPAASDRTPPRVAAWLSLAVTVLVLLVLTGCAQQRIRDQSQTAMASGDYEAAVRGLEAGLKDYPDSVMLRGGLLLARTEAQSRMVTNSSALRQT
jgi:general secretion pathway protein D